MKLLHCPFCGCVGVPNNCNSFLIEFKHKPDCFLSLFTSMNVGFNGSEQLVKQWNTRSLDAVEVCPDCCGNGWVFINDLPESESCSCPTCNGRGVKLERR